MQPEGHEKALVAFFRRHNLVAPTTECDGVIERHGLVLAMAIALRDAGFRVATSGAPRAPCTIAGTRFTAEEVLAAGGEAHKLAHLIENILDGCAADPEGSMVDRMAFLMRRMERAELPVTPEALGQEDVPIYIVIEYGVEAAQLAEAIKVGIAAWHRSAAARADGVRLLEAA